MCLSPYSQLFYKVKQLSFTLIYDYHITLGDVICQFMDRSIEMIIGILAILVSGGIYVPLNPCDSSRRLDSLIQQIKPKLILRDILCSAYQCEQLPEVSITGESKLSSHQDPLVLQKVFRFDIEISSLT